MRKKIMPRWDKYRNLPISYYLNNGTLAEKIIAIISQQDGEVAAETIHRIQRMVHNENQECLGEPTLAKAVLELIEKVTADPGEKLHLILETAKLTLLLRNLKIKQLH